MKWLLITCFSIISLTVSAQLNKSRAIFASQYLLHVPTDEAPQAWVDSLTTDSRIKKDTNIRWQGRGELLLFGDLQPSVFPTLQPDTVRVQLSKEYFHRSFTVNGRPGFSDSVVTYNHLITFHFKPERFDAASWKAFEQSQIKLWDKYFNKATNHDGLKTPERTVATFTADRLLPRFHLLWWQDKKSGVYKFSVLMLAGADAAPGK